MCVGTWDSGTRDKGLEDLKYGTRGRMGRGCKDIKYRDAGDAGCEQLSTVSKHFILLGLPLKICRTK